MVHRGEGKAEGPSDEEGGRGSHPGLTKSCHHLDASGIRQGWWAGSVHMCSCASVSYQVSPTTVGRPRLPEPAKEGITFWFSRLNAEVSVN